MMGITHLNRVKNTQNIILFFQITYGVIGTRRHSLISWHSYIGIPISFHEEPGIVTF